MVKPAWCCDHVFIAIKEDCVGVVKDISGMKFGKLTAIERAENDNNGRAKWRCMCDCGNEATVLGKLLRNGHTKSCGCLNKEVVSAMSLRDLTGQKFGKLTVVCRAEDYISPKGKHHVKWHCICDCGKSTVISSLQLTSGKTRSCGCLKVGNVVHGGCHDRLYKVYCNMKDRCNNANGGNYRYYGGRGIRICQEWLDDYMSFKRWAYENGYDDKAEFGKCTLDRIDVDGDYCPDNCRWVDMKVQSNNRRNVINKDKR